MSKNWSDNLVKGLPIPQGGINYQYLGEVRAEILQERPRSVKMFVICPRSKCIFTSVVSETSNSLIKTMRCRTTRLLVSDYRL